MDNRHGNHAAWQRSDPEARGWMLRVRLEVTGQCHVITPGRLQALLAR
jgi:hypothetical protein